MVHKDARSRAGDSSGGGRGGRGDSGGNGDIPASNIHIQDVSVITLKIKINNTIIYCSQAHRHTIVLYLYRYKGGLIY